MLWRGKIPNKKRYKNKNLFDLSFEKFFFDIINWELLLRMRRFFLQILVWDFDHLNIFAHRWIKALLHYGYAILCIKNNRIIGKDLKATNGNWITFSLYIFIIEIVFSFYLTFLMVLVPKMQSSSSVYENDKYFKFVKFSDLSASFLVVFS